MCNLLLEVQKKIGSCIQNSLVLDADASVLKSLYDKLNKIVFSAKMLSNFINRYKKQQATQN